MGSDRDTLIDMGFPVNRVDRALQAVKNAGLQPAMDWLINHPEDDDGGRSLDRCGSSSTRTLASDGGSTGGAEDSVQAEEGEIKEDEQTAQSLQCEDCGRLFRDAAAAERHAAKSSHVNFSESTAQVKPLTEEEKKAKLEELKVKLAEKRAMRTAEDTVSNKDAERLRRKAGQDLTEVKQQMEEKEMAKIIEQKRKEKLEDAKARAAIKAQIEQDRAERAARRNADATRKAEEEKRAKQQVAEARCAEKTAATAMAYVDARLQIRKPDGSTITQSFKADDPLSAVYDFVRSQYPGDFKLTTMFPRKVLAGPDLHKTLRELMLVPSAALAMSAS